MKPELNDEVVGEDGLTDREREFIQTPMSQMRPEDIRYGLGMLDKRAEHNYKENEQFRKEEEERRRAAMTGEQSAA